MQKEATSYLLTWTTYGSWHPGDPRGFVSRVPDGKGGRVIHNVPGEPYDADMPLLAQAARRRQKAPTVVLAKEHARIAVAAFREVCKTHGAYLCAGAVMHTHVHLVGHSNRHDGTSLLKLFKGVSSRRLGQKFGPRPGGHWWTDGGSRRTLRDARAIEDAVTYVLNQPNALGIFTDVWSHPPGWLDDIE